MKKLTIEDVAGSDTPYLDVFGEALRGRGRPSGATHDYESSMEVPSSRLVPDREEARRIRNRVRHRTLSVLQAVMAEEARKIYRAELALELGRVDLDAPPEHRPVQGRKGLLSKDDAKKLPGSGLKPGETYWDWMKTYGEKDDATWAQEKITVAANIAKVQRGNHG